ncbi:MAG: hypothetical protein V1862_04725 [Methanobacteriota archaeon]
MGSGRSTPGSQAERVHDLPAAGNQAPGEVSRDLFHGPIVTTGKDGARSPATEQGLHLIPVLLRNPGEGWLCLAGGVRRGRRRAVESERIVPTHTADLRI